MANSKQLPKLSRAEDAIMDYVLNLEGQVRMRKVAQDTYDSISPEQQETLGLKRRPY